MKKYFFAIGLVLVLVSSFFVVDMVYAKKTLNDAQPALSSVSGKSGITEGSVSTIIGNLARGVLSLAGIIFFILAVYAGMIWMTARGNEERVTKARNTLIASIIGLVILVSSYAITNFIQTRVIGGGGGSKDTPGQQDQAGGVALGCCLDWINKISDPAARWTTYDDCKKFGEMPDDVDRYCAEGHNGGPGPKEDCWLFFPETGTSGNMPNITTCLEKSESY